MRIGKIFVFLRTIMDLKDKKIAVLLSGGVDSSVVLYELVRQGLQPDCFYIKIGPEEEEEWDCSSEEDLEMATAVSHKYGCKLEVIDCHKEYWDQVTRYTMDKVRAGLTPNPDVMCNRLIKFGAFHEKRGHDYDLIATGHYATTEEEAISDWQLAVSQKPKAEMALHQSGPSEGPDGLPGADLRLAAGEGAVSHRPHDEGGGARDSRARTPGTRPPTRLAGHLFLRENQL